MEIALIMLLLLILVGFAYLKISNKMYLWWEAVRRIKKYAIKQDIVYIQEINNRTSGNGKKINFLEKGKIKKTFIQSKNKFEQYVEFCENKNLQLTSKEEEICSSIIETEDFLDPAKALDRQLERSIKEYTKIYNKVNETGEKLLSSRKNAAETILSVEVLVNSIAKSPKTFEKEINKIVVIKKQFTEALDFGKVQSKALKESAIGVGAGMATGTAVATLAPSAAMWVATTFGTASTGTAISALSGAAATNAALAWLGGGAIAAGGSGMAAGQALLLLAGPVGWGIAGGSVLTSILFFWKKHMKIQEGKKEEVARIKNSIVSLKKLMGDMEAVNIETINMDSMLNNAFENCKYMESGDYSTFTDEQKDMLAALVNNTKGLAALISKVFVTEENNEGSKKIRKAIKK